MAREEFNKRYYDSILQSKNYIDMRRPIQVCVMDYISQVFFGKDFSRVLYTDPAYAFRKRLETLANGIDGDQIFITNLQLPFATFYISSAPKITKSVSASEWSGYYDEELDQRIHFSSILQDVKVQFYFDNMEDATVAYTLAMQESHSRFPVRFFDEVYWRNKPAKLPLYITIKDIHAGNESFNENDKLKAARMFAMTLDLEVETVQIHINKGRNAVQLPFKWHKTGNVDDWEENDVEYYTRKCTLIFAKKEWGVDFNCKDQEPDNPQELEDLKEVLCSNMEPCDDYTLQQIAKYVPNNAITEMIEGYFREPTTVTFNKLKYNEEKTTIDEKGEVTAWIDTIIKPATGKYWYETVFRVPGRNASQGEIKMQTCRDDHVLIDGLHPNSEYEIFVISRDLTGNFNTIPLKFTTPIWKKEILPVADNSGPEELFNVQSQPEPEKIVPRGLIGLEL